MKFKIILQVAVLVSAIPCFGEEDPKYTYTFLKETRSQLTLPSYSTEEKKLVLDQAYMVMNEIFVHRELKLQHFGAETDALPLLKNLEGKLEKLDARDFHNEMIKIFSKQNDLHTSYNLPKPYACYRSLLPFSFKEVINLDGKKVIAVSKISDKEGIIKIVPNPGVEVGDILLTYNGAPALTAAKDWEPRSAGANPEAVHRRSINLLSYLSHKYEFLPDENSVELVLRNRHGKNYSVTVPWLAAAEIECLKPKSDEEEAGLATDNYQMDFNRIFQTTNQSKQKTKSKAEALKATAEPTLKYKIVKNEYGDFGYISLESFKPEKLTPEKVIEEVKNLLLNQLAKTDGLIFDLRNNGGGYIYLAEALVQLFTPQNPTPLNFRLKNSPANRYYMNHAFPENRFTTLLKEAEIEGRSYTEDHYLNFSGFIDELGQFYFKPVALFTNSSCYSSCDMFAALMQDHEAAIIFGEDSTTGAGGANNVSYNYIIKKLPKDPGQGPFRTLPAGQDIGFSFRQSVRTGKSSGVLIEDRGILSDKIALPSISDLHSESADQFKTIGKVLNEQAKKERAWVAIPEGVQDFLIAEEPKIQIKWHRTDRIEFKSGGQSLRIVDVEDSNSTGRIFPLPKSQTLEQDAVSDYEIIGYFNGERAWRKIFKFRFVPEALSLSEDLLVTFKDDSTEPFRIYNPGSDTEDGWLVQDGALKVGKAQEYSNYVSTTASLFLDMSKEKIFSLKFDAEISTEKDSDFFSVKVVLDGKESELVKAVSGEEVKSFEIDLGPYKGKKIELKLMFDSDASVVGKGVILKNISLLSKP